MDAGTAIDPRERADLLLRDLRSSRSGLSPREAQRRLDQYGANEIPRREGAGHLRALAQQFIHPLALLLWVAAALALVAGIAALAAAIVAEIILNAAFAFVQELQAERATEALQRMLPPQVRVRRGSQTMDVDAAALVPGDVLYVAEGLQPVCSGIDDRLGCRSPVPIANVEFARPNAGKRGFARSNSCRCCDGNLPTEWGLR